MSNNPEKKRYNRIALFYDLMEFLPEKLSMGQWRRRLLRKLQPGLTLEVGVGTGKNLRFYSGSHPVIAGDISRKMLLRARRKAGGSANFFFVLMNAEALPFKDHCFQNIISTFVFCSVADPVTGMKELKRTLHPEGMILFLEHMMPGSKILRLFFNLFNPFVRMIIGANINRETVRNMKTSGLVVEHKKCLLGEIVKEVHCK